MKKKLISVLAAMAAAMSAAAAASVFITLAEMSGGMQEEAAAVWEQEMFLQQGRSAAVRAGPAAVEEVISVSDIKEQEYGDAESGLILQDEAEHTAAFAKIREAESRASSAGAPGEKKTVDVGNVNQWSGTVIPCSAGASVEDTLWYFFKSLGFTDAGAAAALGNLSMESGLNPAAQSPNFDYEKGLGGAGLAGWMSRGRLKGLMELAKKSGGSWKDLTLQMAYLEYELEHGRKRVAEEMRTIADPDYAADVFCVYFEGCIGRSASCAIDGISAVNGKWYQGLEKRKALARMYYGKYTKN